MKAIILAAGSGRRLAPMGWDKPKCLLEFGKTTLLDNIVQALGAYGIENMAIVLGYKRPLVEEAMKRHDVAWEVVVNDAYADTNTIYSLWLARRHMDDDFIYFNADVLFDRRIVGALLPPKESALAVEEKVCGDEEVKVVVDGERRIRRIGKKLDPSVSFGEFIGIGKFASAACPAFIEALRRHNEVLAARNQFFELAVDDILQEHPHIAAPIGAMRAIEIDSPEDYHAAKELWDSGRINPA